MRDHYEQTWAWIIIFLKIHLSQFQTYFSLAANEARAALETTFTVGL